MDLTRDSIVEALTEIGERLHRQNKIGEITVFGGAAMLLQFDTAFVTGDIDAVIDAEHGALTRAVRDIGLERGWYSTWLNDGVQQYLAPEGGAGQAYFRSFPNEERVGLRVFLAKPEYLLALKLRALRGGTRDREDALALARHLELRTQVELQALVARNFPSEPLDERRRRLLFDLAAELSQ